MHVGVNAVASDFGCLLGGQLSGPVSAQVRPINSDYMTNRVYFDAPNLHITCKVVYINHQSCIAGVVNVKKKIESEGVVEASNRPPRPRPLHRGRRYPQRTPATSVEGSGSGSPIGGPNPVSTEDSESESPVNSGLGPPIGDPNPFTEVVGTHAGRRRPQWRGRGRRLVAPTSNQRRTPDRGPQSIRSWGHQSATPTPPLRLPTSSVGTNDLGGGVRVVD
ncbi:hypothetical protein CRG98_033690 [Punica granatum]|uniref:Uncharacterized protein n=1 Tax=Punica granatum TaxID=22663 RepID=A0A2I0IPG8_PUNGR|nr:hypothetical protein CRG98_033690 [Punica granatum]